MNIFEKFQSRDIVTDNITINELVSFNLTNTPSTTAIDTLINSQVVSQATNLLNVSTTNSLSSYYNSIKWLLYQESGINNIEILSGTSSSASLTAHHIKIISIPRETLKDGLYPTSCSATITITVSSVTSTYYVIDDPVISTSGTALFQGSLKIGTTPNFVPSASLTSIGEVFYNYGTFVFRGSDVGNSSLSAFLNSTSAYFVNYAGNANNAININSFSFNRLNNQNSKIFFCRAYNDAFNYSNNPTYRNPDSSIIQPVINLGYVTFITTIGIYDDNNNLLAVAKVNPPQLKSFSNEALFKVSLVY